ncbi:MAG TPA: translation elongation factor Ts [Terriglobales bacterium]|nr:translation elongation factor Ts [Terriglobales bacterium]
MEITAADVKSLRERTGAPMMECKRALTAAGGDASEAEKVLRRQGIASAAKKSARTASEGSIGSYIHAGGKLGVLLEIACESDFVARTEEFQQLVHDVAMHIAAAGPRYLSRELVPAAELESERAIYRQQVANMNPGKPKPENVVEKIVEGKLGKFFEEQCLLDQHFVKDDKLTIGELIASKVAKFGENIQVRRFARFKVGDESAT